jgi:Predicted sulfurtransferase
MAFLHNRISNKELKERLYQETEPRTTISFYRYFPIADPRQFRDEFYLRLSELHVFGRIYVAHEGINAQASVPQSKFEALREYLYSIPELNGMRINIAVDDNGKSFWVLKVKVRPKIVADGIDDPDFDMSRRGRYVNAEQMNEMLKDPNTIVVDMRNHYEYEVGHFVRAVEVPSDTFREQLPMAVDMLKDKKDANIIMYCTGGIRCEKASAYMLHKGFKNVFHLEGGIINYARQIKEKGLESKFIGKNFVFDERLGERITNDIIAVCHQCGKPADTHVNCANEGCHMLFIQCEECRKKYDGCCSTECQQILKLPEEQRKAARKGKDLGRNIFNKSKAIRPRLPLYNAKVNPDHPTLNIEC